MFCFEINLDLNIWIISLKIPGVGFIIILIAYLEKYKGKLPYTAEADEKDVDHVMHADEFYILITIFKCFG